MDLNTDTTLQQRSVSTEREDNSAEETETTVKRRLNEGGQNRMSTLDSDNELEQERRKQRDLSTSTCRPNQTRTSSQNKKSSLDTANQCKSRPTRSSSSETSSKSHSSENMTASSSAKSSRNSQSSSSSSRSSPVQAGETKEKSTHLNSDSENEQEDGQRWTPPPHSALKKKSRLDTPDPRQLTARSRSSSPEEAAVRPVKQKSRVSFEESITEDSSSESDQIRVVPSTQSKHYIKPPKFNGTTLFESFYARFENCASYNRWSRSDKLYHLRNALEDDASQVLFDSAPEVTNSLSKLVGLLKARYGGSAQSDKYKIDLRTRVRQDNERLQTLHQDISE